MVKLHDPISEALERVDGARPPRREDVRELLREFGLEDRVKLKWMKRLPPQRALR